MKLTYEQIKSAATGVVYTEKTENGIEFHRFSRSQTAEFAKPHSLFTDPFFDGYFGRNCRTTSGVTLDFYTDAEEVRVGIASNERINDTALGLFDLYLGGKYSASFEADKDIVFTKSKKPSRVTLYFPYFNFPTLSGVELVGASKFEPTHRGEPDLLCIGDSITHGVMAAHPSRNYVSVMARCLGLSFINQGNSGYVYDANVLERVCSPRLITCAYGVNDIGRKSAEQIRVDTDAFMKKLTELYPESKVLAILPTWTIWDAENKNWKAEEREIFISIYKKYGAYIVDGQKMFPHDTKYLADKAVHPNDEGFAYYGNRLSKYVEELLGNN